MSNSCIVSAALAPWQTPPGSTENITGTVATYRRAKWAARSNRSNRRTSGAVPSRFLAQELPTGVPLLSFSIRRRFKIAVSSRSAGKKTGFGLILGTMSTRQNFSAKHSDSRSAFTSAKAAFCNLWPLVCSPLADREPLRYTAEGSGAHLVHLTHNLIDLQPQKRTTEGH